MKVQDNILRHLPDYSEIILLLPKCNLELIKSDLLLKPYHNHVRFVVYDEHVPKTGQFFLLFPEKDKLVQMDAGKFWPDRQHGTIWSQDLFEVAKMKNGKTILLTSAVHKYYYGIGDKYDYQVARDNVYIDSLSSAGLTIQVMPFVFMGGNLFVDRIDDKRVVLLGGDLIRKTQTAWLAVDDKKLSQTEIVLIIKDILNADEVVVIGYSSVQPRIMYHLDQAMILLPDGVAAVACIVDDYDTQQNENDEIAQVEQFLVELRSVLSGLGYKIIDINITIENVLNCRHYVNAIPYIDARTDQKTLLMPVFTSEQTELDKKLIQRNTAMFNALGYQVIEVPTKADQLRGGIHCLLNVLE